MDTDICHCGHVRDEHDRRYECQVEGCGCVHLELNVDAQPDEPQEPDWPQERSVR